MLAEAAQIAEPIRVLHAPIHRNLPPIAPRELGDLIEAMGTVMNFGRNTEIYGEGEPAEFIYKVISGAVRTYKILADGRRQICSFYLAGDLLGLGAVGNYAFSAEAISNAKIVVVKRSSVVGLAARNNHFAQQLWGQTSGELRRVQDHLLLLIRSAQERVAGFLLEMAGSCGSVDEIDLPMSRQDIADYLGLTIETVSRTLTSFENAATIALPSARKVMLLNRGALSRLNS
jgi:CRP-like cAMP-binding protein